MFYVKKNICLCFFYEAGNWLGGWIPR